MQDIKDRVAAVVKGELCGKFNMHWLTNDACFECNQEMTDIIKELTERETKLVDALKQIKSYEIFSTNGDMSLPSDGLTMIDIATKRLEELGY